MMELFNFDDVGQGYDLALADEGQVAVTLGRHTSDFITSFYTWTPSAFMVEYGWGARTIDVERWKAYERKEGPEHLGARPALAVTGRQRQSAGATPCQRRRRLSPARSSDRG
jgi:hypothetical protein